MNADRIKELLKRIQAINDEERYTDGLLGRINSDGSATYVPRGMANHKYVRIRNSDGSQSTVRARDDIGVAQSRNLPVRIKATVIVQNSGVVTYTIVGLSRDESKASVPASPGSGVPIHIHDDRYFTEAEHIDASAGVADAGKPVKTAASGQIDPSLIDTAGNMAAAIDGATEQTVLEAANAFPLTDTGVLKWVSWTNWLASLVALALTWTNNVIIASTATTGNALRVIRNLTSTSTDAPVVDIVQDHASDDQAALRVQQDGTGALLSLFDAATEVVTVEDGGNVGINQPNPAYKTHMLTGTDDGLYIEGSGVGGPIIVLDATNATVGSRFTGLILSSGGVRQWSQQLRFGDGNFHWFDVVNLLTRMLLTNTGNLGIGLTTGATILARLHVLQNTLGSVVQRLQSTATNDDPIEDTIQGRVATTDATVTTLHTYTIPATTTVVLEAHVTARRTGGVAGTAEDGAGYGIVATFKNVAGTATQIGATTVLYTHESQAAWDCVFDVTGATARVRVTGATNNNVTWHLSALRVRSVSS